MGDPFCTPKDMFLKGLPSKTRERFAHYVDHRFGRPAVPTIVEEREGENLTIYRRDVPGQCDDLISGTRLGVQVSLGGGVPHPPLQQLRVASDGQG